MASTYLRWLILDFVETELHLGALQFLTMVVPGNALQQKDLALNFEPGNSESGHSDLDAYETSISSYGYASGRRKVPEKLE